MNLFKKVGRGLIVLAMAPLFELEKREQEKLLEKRLKRSKRSEQRHCSCNGSIV